MRVRIALFCEVRDEHRLNTSVIFPVEIVVVGNIILKYARAFTHYFPQLIVRVPLPLPQAPMLFNSMSVDLMTCVASSLAAPDLARASMTCTQLRAAVEQVLPGSGL